MDLQAMFSSASSWDSQHGKGAYDTVKPNSAKAYYPSTNHWRTVSLKVFFSAGQKPLHTQTGPNTGMFRECESTTLFANLLSPI